MSADNYSKAFYSKTNPNGPYAGRTQSTMKGKPQFQYIEGQATKKNLDEWSARARANSTPPKKLRQD